MIILVHVILAITSLVLATVNFFAPERGRLTTSYLFALGTLASGALLIIVNNASVLRTCLTGIVFFGVVSMLNELARRKLTTQSVRFEK